MAALVVLLNCPLNLTGTRKGEEGFDCIELMVHSVIEVYIEKWGSEYNLGNHTAAVADSQFKNLI